MCCGFVFVLPPHQMASPNLSLHVHTFLDERANVAFLKEIPVKFGNVTFRPLVKGKRFSASAEPFVR